MCLATLTESSYFLFQFSFRQFWRSFVPSHVAAHARQRFVSLKARHVF
jgi:hypothetical protein